MTLFLFSVFIISRMSVKAVENMFIFALGAVFCRYITPTIWIFFVFGFYINKNRFENMWYEDQTDMSSRIVY